MMQLILTRSHLYYKSINKDINDLTIKDFSLANNSVLGYAHSVIFIDEETKISRTIR